MSEKEDEEKKSDMSSAKIITSESFPCYNCNQNFSTQSTYNKHLSCTSDNVA